MSIEGKTTYIMQENWVNLFWIDAPARLTSLCAWPRNMHSELTFDSRIIFYYANLEFNKRAWCECQRTIIVRERSFCRRTGGAGSRGGRLIKRLQFRARVLCNVNWNWLNHFWNNECICAPLFHFHTLLNKSTVNTSSDLYGHSND